MASERRRRWSAGCSRSVFSKTPLLSGANLDSSPRVTLEFPNPADIPRARRAIVEVCTRMHARGYIVAGDGNVSVRIGENRILVTPSGARKGFLDPADLVLCTLDGEPIRGEKRRPSAEIAMHVTVYAERSDVMAVVHAHPPCAVAHTIAGVSLAGPLMPETFCALGAIQTLPYTTPTTREVPDAIREPIRNSPALLLDRHGSITVGSTLAEAYDRLEILENSARVSMMARVLALGGSVQPLDPAKLRDLGIYLGCGMGA